MAPEGEVIASREFMRRQLQQADGYMSIPGQDTMALGGIAGKPRFIDGTPVNHPEIYNELKQKRAVLPGNGPLFIQNHKGKTIDDSENLIVFTPNGLIAFLADAMSPSEDTGDHEDPGPRVLKPGDVVRLKSGGPQMTIEEIDDDGCFCTWFATPETEAQCERFKPKALDFLF